MPNTQLSSSLRIRLGLILTASVAIVVLLAPAAAEAATPPRRGTGAGIAAPSGTAQALPPGIQDKINQILARIAAILAGLPHPPPHPPPPPPPPPPRPGACAHISAATIARLASLGIHICASA